MAPPLKVAVIGAGVAGLATARALKREGQQVVVYEKLNQVGGLWIYEPQVESDPLSLDPDREIVHGSVYQSLHTNLPMRLMGFSDYPFAIRKNVVQVELVDSRNHRWVVESRTKYLSSNTKEVFDAVVVCNGHHTQPNVAYIQGIEKWPGKQIHSHNYRVPEPFKDRIVVVIGDGPTGKDVSLEISKVAKEVHLSSRSPNVKICKLDCADNMWQHSKIDHVKENGEVAFEDDAYVRADIILHCTGFKYDFPILKTEGIVTVDDNRVGPVYKHIFSPELAPSLSFVGLTFHSLIFLMMDLQANWVARVLSGTASLPSKEDMLAEVQQHYQHMEYTGIPKHYTHDLGYKFDYLDWLANQVGLGEPDEQLKLILKSYSKFIIDDNGYLRRREWELGYGLQEEELLLIQSDLEKANFEFHFLKQFDYLDWMANQVGLQGVDEQVKLIRKSYFKFVGDNGDWRHREWELVYGLQEEELLLLQSGLERVKLDET
ncbi:hypothetical protein BUALT_Bualt19G0017900 [Buddleja alternifolia]|uniref:Flavin-containing monooxygenase n=1 Tax=Buddleja alternifolia TaxID=168488 RepID=A0AAV6W4G0_9LAMI|nr:hypothetical protein BUALT_Bualt19G0017900 [Buddleja alternifolia]